MVKPRHLVLGLLLATMALVAVRLLRAYVGDWGELETASRFFVNVTILLGAGAAIVKFQLYNLLGHRWRSDLKCQHHDLADGSVVFTADYIVTNTGQRPLRLSHVHVRLLGAASEGVLLKPDDERCLAERVLSPDESTLQGLFQIEPSERAIFTLRCRLPHLDEVVFIRCGFRFSHQRVPAAYTGVYVKGGAAGASASPAGGAAAAGDRGEDSS